MCLVNIDKGRERKKAKYGDFLLISQETHRNHKTCFVQCSHRQQLPAEPCAIGDTRGSPRSQLTPLTDCESSLLFPDGIHIHCVLDPDGHTQGRHGHPPLHPCRESQNRVMVWVEKTCKLHVGLSQLSRSSVPNPHMQTSPPFCAFLWWIKMDS